MKQIFLILTLTYISINMQAQTDQHVQIKGTNLFMIPPEGFTTSENFKGFQDESNPYSMIMVVEMPGPYAEISKGFSDEMMSTRGMTMTAKEDLRMGIDEGLYIEMEQDANGIVFSKSLIVYGDDQKTTIVNGACLKENDSLYQQIIESVKSTLVDSTLSVDPRQELNFSVDETTSELQFVGVVGNGMIFNRDGLLPTESQDELNVVIDKSLAPVQTSDYEQFSRTRISQYPGFFMVDEDKGVSDITIDGLQGKKLFAINQENQEETLYQVILFSEDGGYYIMIATYIEASEQTLNDIEAVFQSFKRK